MKIAVISALLVLASASAAAAQQTGAVPVPPPPRASAPVPPPVGQPVAQADETAVSVPAPPPVTAAAPPGPVGPIVTVIPGAQTTVAANTPPARRSTATPQVTLQIELDTQGGGGGGGGGGDGDGGGKIAVAIYQDAESFRRGEGALRTLLVDRNGPVTRAWVLGMTPGRYAIAAFHDIDGDGVLGKWAFGLPKEPYGFSNDARGRFGPPTFEAAAFTLPASGATERLQLRAPIGGGGR